MQNAKQKIEEAKKEIKAIKAEKAKLRESKKVEDISHFKTHPIYDLYACDPEKGLIVNKQNKVKIGTKSHDKYINVSVRSKDGKQKNTYAHRFIWECVNGVIPKDKEIDHIDEDNTNNKISNLQMITHKENLLRSSKNRDYSFVKINHKKSKAIKATDENKIESHYQSIYKASKETGINIGIISYAVRGLNNVKGGTSKTDGKYYTFSYSNQKIDKVRKHKKVKDVKEKKNHQIRASEYYKNKYHNDPVFRERMLATQKKYYENKKSKKTTSP